MSDDKEYNTSRIGLIVEEKCIVFLLEQNLPVLKPIGNDLKYDLVFEKDTKFYKVQCKHATKKNRGFVIKTAYSHRNGKREKYTKKDCDFFMTEVDGKFYLLPVLNTLEKKFWLETPKNKVATSLKASDFLAEDIIAKL